MIAVQQMVNDLVEPRDGELGVTKAPGSGQGLVNQIVEGGGSVAQKDLRDGAEAV